jgi:hypothetical protein
MRSSLAAAPWRPAWICIRIHSCCTCVTPDTFSGLAQIAFQAQPQLASTLALPLGRSRQTDVAARKTGSGALHEYVCKKCNAAKSPAYHAATLPDNALAAHLPTVVADGSAGNQDPKISGGT